MLRWLIGLATSLIGNHIYLVTLAWVAVQTTTPANVGLILVAGAIPQAALLLVGGVFVDRIGPKLTIIASDVLRTLIMVVFAIVVAGGEVKPLLLGALAVMFGVVDGFFLPAVSNLGTWSGGFDHARRRSEDDRGARRRVRRRTTGQLAACRCERGGCVLGERLVVRGFGRLLAMTRMALPERMLQAGTCPTLNRARGCRCGPT